MTVQPAALALVSSSASSACPTPLDRPSAVLTRSSTYSLRVANVRARIRQPATPTHRSAVVRDEEPEALRVTLRVDRGEAGGVQVGAELLEHRQHVVDQPRVARLQVHQLVRHGPDPRAAGNRVVRRAGGGPRGSRAEAGGVERVGQCGGSVHALAVGALDREPAEAALADGEGQGVGGGLERGRVLGPGQQSAAAALDVERQRAVDEHDQRAGLPARAVPAAAVAGRPGAPATAARRRTAAPGRPRPAPPPATPPPAAPARRGRRGWGRWAGAGGRWRRSGGGRRRRGRRTGPRPGDSTK